MSPRTHLFLLTAALAVTGGAHGRDLGTIGPVYPISEPHLLDFIRHRLQEKERTGELKVRETLARERGIQAVTRPEPVAGIQPVAMARTFHVDPTFTLDRPIFDHNGNLLFAAGTRKNPLDIVALSKRLLFFDARDKRQVTHARELVAFYRERNVPVKPILVGGSYLDLMTVWRTPVYYDQHGVLTRRLRVTRVPALVSQDGQRLRIDELVLP